MQFAVDPALITVDPCPKPPAEKMYIHGEETPPPDAWASSTLSTKGLRSALRENRESIWLPEEIPSGQYSNDPGFTFENTDVDVIQEPFPHPDLPQPTAFDWSNLSFDSHGAMATESFDSFVNNPGLTSSVPTDNSPEASSNSDQSPDRQSHLAGAEPFLCEIFNIQCPDLYHYW